MQISVAAKRAGVSPPTIRYYEKIGLLPKYRWRTSPGNFARRTTDGNWSADGRLKGSNDLRRAAYIEHDQRALAVETWCAHPRDSHRGTRLAVLRNQRRLCGCGLGVRILECVDVRFVHPDLLSRDGKETIHFRRYFTSQAHAQSLLTQGLKKLVNCGGIRFQRAVVPAGDRQQGTVFWVRRCFRSASVAPSRRPRSSGNPEATPRYRLGASLSAGTT
jgi:MerR-like DNA binding protein